MVLALSSHDDSKLMTNNGAIADGEWFAYDNDDVYRTATGRIPWFSRTFPTFNFYRKFCWNVYRSSVKARRGQYDAHQWSQTSYEVLEALESVGVQTEICGVDHVRSLETPCVFIGNHMSMLETMVLPAIIQPVCDVTFVVKQSLLEYPLFRHIVNTRNPIAVSRDNPREDFKAVMHGGLDRLKKGISVVVFPQTKRSQAFDSAEFNSIGVKLAMRAQVPVVPIALKTDAWGNGRIIKDLGRINPKKTVHLSFGKPITIEGRGGQQHQQIIDFIQAELNEWHDPASASLDSPRV